MSDHYNIHKNWCSERDTLHNSLIQIRYSCLFGPRG